MTDTLLQCVPACWEKGISLSVCLQGVLSGPDPSADLIGQSVPGLDGAAITRLCSQLEQHRIRQLNFEVSVANTVPYLI